MERAEVRKPAVGTNMLLVALGCTFLVYALIGNYVALPGYLRFLERGATSEAGNAFDLDVLVGAAKTIVWMFSFQLGVLCLATAHSLRESLHTRFVVLGGVIWITLWAWPTLPAPPPWFYVLFGSILLVSIGVVLSRAQPNAQSKDNRLNRSLFLGAVMFFAFATWEVCGLGSTGRILHPEQARQAVAQNILVTQTSKLMVEFVIAWALLAASLLPHRYQRA